MKDSRAINASDREAIVAAVRSGVDHHFVVTHGTWTMAASAQFVAERFVGGEAVVVFTGAMTPLDEPDTDAPAQLDFAPTSAMTLSPGVYVCMDGQVFTPDNVVKNAEAGRFQTLHSHTPRTPRG